MMNKPIESLKYILILAAQLLIFGITSPISAHAQACLGTCTIAASPNDYWPGTANAAVNATAVTIGAQRTGAGAGGNQIAIGDMVMVIQMQDATINTADSAAYGSGGATGAGYTAARQTGLYEYAVATNAITAAGGTLNLSKPLLNAYNMTTSTGQSSPTFQIIRVPNCITANLSGAIGGAAWNGSTGGVVALRSYTLNMGGATINANGLGFRGGATDAHNGPVGGAIRYNGTNLNDQYKGEGIAGAPDFIYDTSSATEIATGRVFPGGYRGVGAPGNAGGGGEGDSGGGGGGNGGTGGRGGLWSNVAGLTAGLGGAVFAQTTFSRAILGGGGAGGSSNTGATTADETIVPYGTGANTFNRGGAGGGLVILTATVRTGNLTINANGVGATGTAYASTTSGSRVGGGGGAGGSVVLYGTGGTITANAAAVMAG
jgi:hypothetical protein